MTQKITLLLKEENVKFAKKMAKKSGKVYRKFLTIISIF